jgi:hypothetical protein
MGFTLHAATIVRRDDAAGKEALARYVLRPHWLRSASVCCPTAGCVSPLNAPFQTAPSPSKWTAWLLSAAWLPPFPVLVFTQCATQACCLQPPSGGRSSCLTHRAKARSPPPAQRSRAPLGTSRSAAPLGEPTQAPQRAAPRAPPYFQTLAVIRQKPLAVGGEGQAELFDPPG